MKINNAYYVVTLLALISITTGLNAKEWFNMINNARTELLTAARADNLDRARELAGQFLDLASGAVQVRAYEGWRTDLANLEIMPLLDEVFNARIAAQQEAERQALQDYAASGRLQQDAQIIVDWLNLLTEEDLARMR